MRRVAGAGSNPGESFWLVCPCCWEAVVEEEGDVDWSETVRQVSKAGRDVTGLAANADILLVQQTGWPLR